MPTWAIVVLVVVGIVVIVIIAMFNTLIGRKNRVANIFGTMDAMLKKRYDLIPNLVATVQGYMMHERQTLEKVTQLRAEAMKGGLSDNVRVALDNQISRLLMGIMANVENYPQLKASQNFMHLQRTLTELEEQIAAARRAFNAAVMDYNNAVQMFPTNMVAGMMGYEMKNYFEIDDGQRGSVKASFSG
jgi:LemA protein